MTTSVHPTPKGVASKAQGWRFAYPGKAKKNFPTPKGLRLVRGVCSPENRLIPKMKQAKYKINNVLLTCDRMSHVRACASGA
jgi:hypothetical protein